MVSCSSSQPWKVIEKLDIFISRLRGCEASEPVHERASAFNLASSSNFRHNASVNIFIALYSDLARREWAGSNDKLLCLTFGANSRAVGAILHARALLLAVLSCLLIIALRFFAGLPRLRSLLLLLLLFLLCVGRHCLSPGIYRRLRLRYPWRGKESQRSVHGVFARYVRHRLGTCVIRKGKILRERKRELTYGIASPIKS
ncbi:hypothetical protein ALC56_01527 [Trachymyrmex septentrionalis]|uniref:Uncharacterized protein n=1 Tax=Trachymyrmex septentrionalis TaxID=34720 RepID=A0A195FVW9_9HYME|nr:hypothetical protein ALC56_01527 [Trachymyrmex septentrionalis]